MSGISIVGNANNATPAELEVNTKALRNIIRPNDYGANGIYALGGASGTMAAGLAAAAPIFSFRNPASGAAIVLVKKVVFSAGGIAAFAAGVASFQMLVARSFTAPDTGGTDLAPGAYNSAFKLRYSMASSSMVGAGDIRISSTATLTAGTRTLDAQPIGSLSSSTTNTAGTIVIPPTILFQASAGDYPLALAVSEGFVIQATVPATGTWTFSVSVVWEELAAY